jgi:isoleucyl-tRNA synthetase
VGRSLRQDSRLRTRQPLGRLLLHADDDRASVLESDGHLRAILLEELNVKDVDLIDDPRAVARLAGKANFRALGPRFGKKAPVAAKVIGAMEPAQLLALRRDGSVELELEGATFAFTGEEVQVVEEGIEPYVAASESGLTVALDTTLTQALVDEGLCREIINKVQNLRKKSGLDVSDRIRLHVAGDDDVVRVLGTHGDRLSGETLATIIETADGLQHTDTFEVDGHEIHVALARREKA